MIANSLPNKENYLNYMLSRLSDLKGLSFRKLPGGVGFFIDERIFGAIVGGRFRLRTPEVCAQTQTDSTYLFAEWARTYCEVPEEVIENKKELMEWINCSISLSDNSAQKSSVQL